MVELPPFCSDPSSRADFAPTIETLTLNPPRGGFAVDFHRDAG
jgi:hypothetical protein